MTTRTKAPVWFTILAIVLLLWGVMGLFACLQQFRLGADAMGPADPYQRRFFAALPGWYNPLYALTVATGFAGALALLAKSAIARPLSLVSVLGIVAMFGWVFLATDLLAVRGLVTGAGFPAVILAIGLFQWWLAGRARARGWIG